MGLLSQLEVKILFKQNMYKATCDTFPKCSGAGSTESEALDKLSHSISRFIGSLVKNTFKNLLNSDRYTELILDTTEKNQQKRVYPIDPAMKQVAKSVLIKVKANEKTSSADSVLDIKTFVKQLDTPRHDDEDSDILEKNLQTETDSDNFVFGFPLSFN